MPDQGFTGILLSGIMYGKIIPHRPCGSPVPLGDATSGTALLAKLTLFDELLKISTQSSGEMEPTTREFRI